MSATYVNLIQNKRHITFSRILILENINIKFGTFKLHYMIFNGATTLPYSNIIMSHAQYARALPCPRLRSQISWDVRILFILTFLSRRRGRLFLIGGARGG